MKTTAITPGLAPFVRNKLSIALQLALLAMPAMVNAQQSAADQNPKPGTLPAVVVTDSADAETASGPVTGYTAKRSAAGTKTDTPLIETPQTVSVVTTDQMRDTNARTLQDALGYTAGVSAEQGSYGALTTESFMMRGFEVQPYEAGILRDGMKYQPNVYNGAQEPYGLERVEVLKGAASVLYGAGAPGGVINTITKRPSSDAVNEVNFEYGEYSRKQIAADYNGKLDDDGIFSYRLTGLERKADSYTDFGRDDRTYIAPAFTWRPSAATSLTLLTSYQHSETTDAPNLPIQGTLLPNPNGQLPVNTYLGEPNFNLFNNTQENIGYLFDHTFDNGLAFHQSARFFHSTLDYQYYQIDDLEDDLRTLDRHGRSFNDNTHAFVADTNLQYKLKTGTTTQTFLVGLDYMDQHHNSNRANTEFAPIDIYAPVYGQPFGDTVATDAWRFKQHGIGFYGQDQIKFGDKWVFLIGGRQDWTTMVDRDLINYPQYIQRDSAFSGHAGLVYLADNGLAPYFSFSQSFAPDEGADRLGNPFKPTRGEEYETGVRYQPPGTKFLMTAAVYQLTETNVQTPDPVDPEDYSIQTGAVRSRGIELEAKGPITKNLDLIAAYTYIDARTTKTNDPTELGKPVISVPHNAASLWLNYGFAALNLPTLHVGAGVRYVGTRPGDINYSVPDEPAYTLVDTMASYESGRWRYSLNVNNATNRRYIPAPCYGGSCNYGLPRTVTGTATYRW